MKRIYFMGDIHGSYTPIQALNRKEELTSEDSIVLLGDTGLNYYQSERDIELKEILTEIGCTIYALRGNHDRRIKPLYDAAPREWVEQFDSTGSISGTFYIEKKFPTIKYFLDDINEYYITTDLGTYKTLVIPGAYSVDKYFRINNGWNWFPDEQLTEEEKEKGLELIDHDSFDFILSHTCPAVFMPTDLFISSINQSIVDNSMERFLGYIESQINYNFWLWGHYHEFRVYPGPPRNPGQPIMLGAGTEALEINNILKGDYYAVQRCDC